MISGGIDLSIGVDDGPDERRRRVLMKGQTRGVRHRRRRRACSLLGLVLGAINGSLVVITRVPGHRRHAGDVVRLGRLRAARAEVPGRRLGAVAEGPRHGLARQRVDPAGGRRPDRRRRPSSGSPSAGRGSACRSTPSAATGWPRSAAACRSAGRRSLAYVLLGLFSALGGPAPHGEHRDRDAGSRTLHAAERRRDRPRRRQPRRRSRRRRSVRSSRSSSSS